MNNFDHFITSCWPLRRIFSSVQSAMQMARHKNANEGIEARGTALTFNPLWTISWRTWKITYYRIFSKVMLKKEFISIIFDTFFLFLSFHFNSVLNEYIYRCVDVHDIFHTVPNTMCITKREFIRRPVVLSAAGLSFLVVLPDIYSLCLRLHWLGGGYTQS